MPGVLPIRSVPVRFVARLVRLTVAETHLRRGQAETTHRLLRRPEVSRGLDLVACRSGQEGGSGHPALPGLVVDGFEQAAVEGDVDPA